MPTFITLKPSGFGVFSFYSCFPPCSAARADGIIEPNHPTNGEAELFLEMLRTIYQTEEVTGYQNGDLDRFFSGGEHRIYVAQCDGNVIAFLSIEVHRLPDLAYLYLDDFCVSGQYRNLGIGTQLLKIAEQYAQTLGISKIVLHVEKSNTAARRLYERFGYQIMKDEGHRYCMAK